MQRAIHIFPEFSNQYLIDNLRKKYDPLFLCIRPHITLVFPFEDRFPTERLVQDLKKCIRDIDPFPVGLQGVSGADGTYLFLNVKTGNDQIIGLHDRLYSGVLKNHLNRYLTYVPHLTAGKLDKEELFRAAIADTKQFDEVFSTIVDEIVIERIDSTGMSHIEEKISLGIYEGRGRNSKP